MTLPPVLPAAVLLAAVCAIPSSALAARIVLVAGGEEAGTGIPATRARLIEPFGTGFDSTGNTYIIEMATGNRLLKVDARGILHHVAGETSGGGGPDRGAVKPVRFNGPHNLAVLPDDNVLIADTWHGVIRHIDFKTGAVSSLPGFEVPVQRARLTGPYCVTLDFAGRQAYVADLRRIHAIEVRTGQARVVAGNGEKGVPADGTKATEAPLVDPRAVAVDRKNNIYILERTGHALRVVGADGRIRTVVNASGKRGASGDGGPAIDAQLNGPKHLCIDRDDNVIIADAENHLIRKYIPSTGKIVRVAGTGTKGAAGVGGSPTECELARPHGVTVHRDGTLFITDSYNNRILKIVP